MSEHKDIILETKLRIAVRESIAMIGIEAFFRTSMFPSAGKRMAQKRFDQENRAAA